MFVKIFFSYFSFVIIFAYSTNLFQNNLAQQMVSSAAPQSTEEVTKAVSNTSNPVASTTNQPIVINSSNEVQNLNPPTNIQITGSFQAPLLNVNPSKSITITSESSQTNLDKPRERKDNTSSLYKQYTAFSLTSEEGENYFQNILKSVDQFSSSESLSHLNAANSVSVNPNTVDAAVVCFQTVSKGYYRVHSLNPKANGLVTDEYDRSLLHRIFKLNKTDRFSFFIRTGSTHSEEILVFNGLVFSKTGQGNERGDSVCFARYNVEKVKPKS